MHTSKASSIRPKGNHEGFCLFFDPGLQNATPYSDRSSYFRAAKGRMDRTIALLKDKFAGRRVLDVGASPFYLLYRAQQLGASNCTAVYYANDTHPLKDTPHIYSSFGQLDLFHVDVETSDLPFPDNSFDIVTACEVLEHLEYFPARLGREMQRVLRPGGLLCITVPNVCRLSNIVKLLLQRNVYMKYRADPTGRHKHEYTLKELEALFRFWGLEIQDRGFLSVPTSEKSWVRYVYAVASSIPLIKQYLPVVYVTGAMPNSKPETSSAAYPEILFSGALSIED